MQWASAITQQPDATAAAQDLLRQLRTALGDARPDLLLLFISPAYATGLPVLATDVGGNAELVQQGQTGLLVPSDDAPAMAQALYRLAQQPRQAAAMGAAGRAAVDARFSLQAMVAAYDALYSEHLQRAGWSLDQPG